jgi:CheY-like chemotaxis protein
MLILIIDDDQYMSSLLQAQCKTVQDTEVTTAYNGYHGLEVMQKKHPELIFCDMNMPTMDGYAFWQALRAEKSTRTIPFVLVSSDVKPDGNFTKNRDKIERIKADKYAQILSKESVSQAKVVEIIEAVRRKS